MHKHKLKERSGAGKLFKGFKKMLGATGDWSGGYEPCPGLTAPRDSNAPSQVTVSGGLDVADLACEYFDLFVDESSVVLVSQDRWHKHTHFCRCLRLTSNSRAENKPGRAC